MKETKPISQYDLDGNFIQSFRSIGEASRKTGLKKADLKYALKRKFWHVGGFAWGYSTKLEVESKQEQSHE